MPAAAAILVLPRRLGPRAEVGAVLLPAEPDVAFLAFATAVFTSHGNLLCLTEPYAPSVFTIRSRTCIAPRHSSQTSGKKLFCLMSESAWRASSKRC